MTRWRELTLVALVALSVVETEAESQKGPTSTAPYRIRAIIYVPEEHQWGIEVEAGMRAAQRETGVELEIRRIGFDLLEEMREIEQAIESGVDAIVVPAVREDSSLYMIQKAATAGIEIVCFNTCVEGTDVSQHVASFVLSDQMEMGYQAGTYLAQWLAETRRAPKIAILQCERFEACYRRGLGFRDALSDAGVEWTLAASREAHLEQLAEQQAISLLRAQPDLEIFWTDSLESTLGAIEGVRKLQAGGELEREVFVFGTELVTATAELLLDPDSALEAVGSMMTCEIGRQAILEAVRAIENRSSDGFMRVLHSPIYTRHDEQTLRQFLALERPDGSECPEPP